MVNFRVTEELLDLRVSKEKLDCKEVLEDVVYQALRAQRGILVHLDSREIQENKDHRE